MMERDEILASWSAVLPRSALALVLLALALPTVATAQETPAAPAITVDPRANVDAMPRQGMLLTGLYATQATIELCAVPLGEPAATAMSAHRRQLETELRMDEPTATAAYDAVKADVEKTGLDCAEGSQDRTEADAVIAIYSGSQPAAPAQ
ncbi:hypothetical protein DMC47_01655 [Nostoc sp. 3335mG]|nr:hypothetical protein DMC47_01655 [Nostoc sp. 3335mG]